MFLSTKAIANNPEIINERSHSTSAPCFRGQPVRLLQNALFTGLPSQSLGRLQLIQNAAARLFGGLRKYDHVTATMKSELHWLRIPERINFKLSTLVYKALHGQGPAYLRELCIPVGDNFHLSSHRSADRGDLLVPRTYTATYGKRAFSTAGPSTWNTLPVVIRQSKTLTVFK